GCLSVEQESGHVGPASKPEVHTLFGRSVFTRIRVGRNSRVGNDHQHCWREDITVGGRAVVWKPVDEVRAARIRVVEPKLANVDELAAGRQTTNERLTDDTYDRDVVPRF